MIVLQITPQLPPAVNGLGDYSLRLAQQLRKDFGIETHFLIDDPDCSASAIDGFPVHQIEARTASALLSARTRCPSLTSVLLHYVGYGYAKRGAPLWLIKGLENWQRHYGDVPLLTMFHEVYASGPFWTSSFWLSPLQKHLAARLSRLSDFCLTSRQGYAEILRELGQNKHHSISVLPVFSNIGEPTQTPLPLKDRRRRLVVFGGRYSRLRVYQNSLSVLKEVCRALEIEEVIDVGPATGLAASRINGAPIVQMGKMPAEKISSLLSDSIAGYLDYDPAFLAKSTIFAAYCAHKLIPICATYNASQVDGLEVGKHYWSVSGQTVELSLIRGQQIADHAYAWYQQHNLSVQARNLISKLRGCGRSFMHV